MMDLPGKQDSLPAGLTRQFVTFRVAAVFMGIDLTRVQEFMRYQEMASVPLASPAVQGLINLRGQIVTALDLRRVFGFVDAGGEAAPRMNIIVQSDGSTVSLLVDEICDVIDVPLNASTQPPANITPKQKALLSAVYQLESSLLLVLNTDHVIATGAD